MSRKKIAALIMGALLAVGIIGGSLAYFTSQDIVPNKFVTTGDETNDGSDIKIVEKFDEEEAGKVEPGTTITKHVQVKNTDDYNQLIKVKFQVRLLDKDKNELPEDAVVNTYKYKGTTETGAMAKVATTITAADVKNNLNATFVDANIVNTLPSNSPYKWYNKDATNTLDSEYFYLGYVSPDRFTEDILKSVQLKPEAGIEYKGINFVVKVIADGVQASNDAFVSEFRVDKTDASGNTTALYTALNAAQSADGSVDIKPGIVDVTTP